MSQPTALNRFTQLTEQADLWHRQEAWWSRSVPGRRRAAHTAQELWGGFEAFARQVGSGELVVDERVGTLFDRRFESVDSPSGGQYLFNSGVGHDFAGVDSLRALTCMARYIGSQDPEHDLHGLKQRIKLALLRAGCWVDRTPSVTGNGFMETLGWNHDVDEATHDRQTNVLTWLLLHPSTADRIEKIPGRVNVFVPPGMRCEQATGWAQAVRLSNAEGVRLWMRAGAQANATDRAQRPVLAYASEGDVVRCLLEAGADPLSSDRPLAERQRNLTALGRGWAARKIRAGDAHPEWEPAWVYLRARLSAWPLADLVAMDELAWQMRLGMREEAVGSDPLHDVLNEQWQRFPREKRPRWARLKGRRWSFAAACHRQWLLGLDISGGPLPEVHTNQKVAEGVREQAIVAVSALAGAPEKNVERTVAQAGLEHVTRALALLVDDYVVDGCNEWNNAPLVAALHRLFSPSIAWKKDALDPLAALALAAIYAINAEDSEGKRRRSYRCGWPADMATPFLAWLLGNARQTKPAYVALAILAFQRAGGPDGADPDINHAVREAMVEAVGRGWSEDDVPPNIWPGYSETVSQWGPVWVKKLNQARLGHRWPAARSAAPAVRL